MTRLLRVELTRLVCRRAVLVLLAAAIVVPAVIGVARVVNTAPPSDDDVAEAERAVQAEMAAPWFRRQLARCEEHPDRHGVPRDDAAAACREVLAPTIEGYLWYDRLRLAQEREEGSGIALVTVLAILGLLAGATFAGHDWASGSMGNQLLFEPRRTRVWLAKAVVVGAGVTAVAAVVMSVFWLGLAAVARGRDIALRDGVLLDCLQMGWRGAAVAGGVAVAGYALTMFFRSTVAALGVLLAIGIAGGTVLAVIGVGSIWNPGLNVLAVVLDGASYWEVGPCGPDALGSTCEIERTLTFERGLTYAGALLAAAVAASLWSFRQRDVG